ncbi:methionyl-tRNA synthetase [Myotisia sp. PD_48]|nr:methionyl-tRNA synthetase [Myotisia sp. PD_48]
MIRAQIRALSSVSKFTAERSRFWICKPCLQSGRGVPRRGFGASADPKKPYYVTTPIFYVNASPHIGHFYTMLLSDILKRWQVLLGNTDAKLLTGTDEHGLKIQQVAQEHEMEPQKLCDKNCETFKALAREANISNDHFIRTTDLAHKEAVRYFWESLEHRGHIYKGKHEGWYSVSDETFYPSSSVQAALDPATGRKIMSTIETGKEVEWSEETNYHFNLSALQDRLLAHYKNNPDFIRPKKYMDSIVREVSSGLEDLSISRPIERLTWGIRVPGDETQTIYVWLDALVNYLTYAGYPFTPGRENESIWPADVQVIGKDISRFHCIYWPAFLMALDLPLPRQILTHAHWTINRAKMSKSTGNVVNPMFAMTRFGVDPMRYFLAIKGGLENDADYENSYVVKQYKHDLQQGLGNLASRVMRAKLWNVRDSVLAASMGQLPEQNEHHRGHRYFLERAPTVVNKHMAELDPRRALQATIGIIHRTNKYMQLTEPWNTSHSEGEVNSIIYNVAESLRIAGILLQPFMPEKSGQLLNMLGVTADTKKRDFSAATYGSDVDYGEPSVPLKKGFEATLFPPLRTED